MAAIVAMGGNVVAATLGPLLGYVADQSIRDGLNVYQWLVISSLVLCLTTVSWKE